MQILSEGMSEPLIKVESVSKSFLLKHQQGTPYSTIRETFTAQVKGLFRRSAKNNFQDTEEFWALRDVSFDIYQGERIGIIGRNGAGKSTLLKILSRIITPTKGRITIEGRVASLLEVGTGFHPELTGRENIFLNGAILGMQKDEITRKFDEIVDFAEVERFLDTPVKRYSSGMYVRLAFAVAAHLEPEILIVDEVLAVGDSIFQKKCLGKMEDVSKAGRTVLFVSHNMATIAALCNKTILLDKGQVLAVGETEKMIHAYLNSGKKNSGENMDDSVPDPEAKLKIRRVRILDQNLQSNAEVHNETKGFIEITFEVLKDGRGYDLAIHLTHLQHGPIFTTCLKDSDITKNDVRSWRKGIYTYRIELPLSILRDGDYSVNASAAIPKVEVLDQFKYETNFYLFDTISPVAITTEGRGGAILPVLEWSETGYQQR